MSFILRSVTLFILCLMLLLNVLMPVHAANYTARWFIETNTHSINIDNTNSSNDQTELSERVKNSVWLEIISDEVITNKINVESITVNGLFIEKTKSGPIYTIKNIKGERKHIAAIKYDIYPAKAGEFDLPKTTVVIGQSNKKQTIYASAKSLTVVPQPAQARGLIITPSLTLTQKLSDVELVAGGIVSRQVSIKVDNLPGYLIAELPVSLYSDFAEVRVVSNSTNSDVFRGTITGQRRSEFQYRFTQQGEYQLPKITVNWWDPEKQQVEQSVLPAIDVLVLPTPPLPFTQRVVQWQSSISDFVNIYQQYIIWCCVILLLCWWQRTWMIMRLKSVKVSMLNLLQRPMVVLLTLTLKACFCSKVKISTLLVKWQSYLDSSIQENAQILSSFVYYESSSSIKVERLCVLKKMCYFNWLHYCQQFTLKPLNPR